MDKGGACISKEYKEFCESKKSKLNTVHREFIPVMGGVVRAIQTLKKLIITNVEENICLIEIVNRALNVMRFTKHAGMKITPFE